MTEKLRIWMNTNAKMSRGKYAAHAVHAALTAAGVHPGTPVVVLGAKPRDIQALPVFIRDAGHTELEPGTITAGTDWQPDLEAVVRRMLLVGRVDQDGLTPEEQVDTILEDEQQREHWFDIARAALNR